MKVVCMSIKYVANMQERRNEDHKMMSSVSSIYINYVHNFLQLEHTFAAGAVHELVLILPLHRLQVGSRSIALLVLGHDHPPA